MDAAKVHARRNEGRGPDVQIARRRQNLGRQLSSAHGRGQGHRHLDYGADLGLKLPPDTLHLALVQAEVSHANIKSIDTSEAEKMPGVFKVVTHKDIKGKNRITGLITFPTNKGDGWDRPILCDEKVFQYGDAIAIVCADTAAQAKAAAEKVKVDLEELPAYMSAPGHGRRRHGDPPGHAQYLFHPENRQGR
jgi:aldehyde oxidoreductase